MAHQLRIMGRDARSAADADERQRRRLSRLGRVVVRASVAVEVGRRGVLPQATFRRRLRAVERDMKRRFSEIRATKNVRCRLMVRPDRL